MLKYILLGFINYRPSTGYDLKQVLDNSTGNFWHAHHSQIYTTLRRMEKDGLVASEMMEEDGRERRVYSITEAGLADLQAWQDSPLTETAPVKEDLLVRVFFSGLRDIPAILDELRLQRVLHQKELDFYQGTTMPHLINEHNPESLSSIDPLLWLSTLEFGIRYQQMYIEWLDQLIARLETKI